MWFGTSSCFKPFLHMTHLGDGTLQLSLHCAPVSVLDPAYQSQLFTLSLRGKKEREIQWDWGKQGKTTIWPIIKPLKLIWYCPEQSKERQQEGAHCLSSHEVLATWLHVFLLPYKTQALEFFSVKSIWLSTKDLSPKQMLLKWSPKADCF